MKNLLLQLRDNIFSAKYKRRVGKPYMMWREIEILKTILLNFQPQRVLEWGAGYSTLYFPPFLNRLSQWISIENDYDWVEHLEMLGPRPEVIIHYIKEDRYPWSDAYNDGAYDDLKTYIEFPCRFEKFDLIYIDGRARRECLLKSSSLLNDQGIVIVHDANRRHYYEGLVEAFDNVAILTDYRRTAGGLFIASRNLDLQSYIDIDRYKKVWKFYNNKLCKILAV